MVNKKLYSVKDEKVGFNSQVFAFDDNGTDNVAVRDFANFVRSPGTLAHSNPEDFSLWCVGLMDSQNGTVDGSVNYCVCKAVDFVEVKNV